MRHRSHGPTSFRARYPTVCPTNMGHSSVLSGRFGFEKTGQVQSGSANGPRQRGYQSQTDVSFFCPQSIALLPVFLGSSRSRPLANPQTKQFNLHKAYFCQGIHLPSFFLPKLIVYKSTYRTIILHLRSLFFLYFAPLFLCLHRRNSIRSHLKYASSIFPKFQVCNENDDQDSEVMPPALALLSTLANRNLDTATNISIPSLAANSTIHDGGLHVICAWPVSGQYGPGSRALFV